MHSDSAKTIGIKVKQVRTEAGLTQQGLSNASGLSRNTIINIEKGNHDTGTNELRLIAKACNKSFTAVFK